MSEVQGNPAGPRRIVDARFSEIDEFHRLVGGWSLDLCQLDAGASSGEYVQIAADGIGVTRFGFSRAYLQRGGSPKGMRTFGLVESGCAGVQCCGVPMGDGDVVLFPSDFEAVSRPGFRAYSVSVCDDLLDDVARIVGVPGVDSLLTTGVRRLDGVALRGLRRALRLACRVGGNGASPDATRETSEHIRFEIPSLLLDALTSTRDAPQVPPSSVRQTAVRRARDLLDRPTDEPLSIREVCAAAGVSWRTLDYGFRELLGIGPKAYHTAIRLHRLRTDLLLEAPPTTVSEVANRRGFWHMGQLAADYRRQFGELPSATLRARPP